MVILDISKCLMYQYFYNELKVRYRDKLTLMATDTDSFIYRVETDDLYKDMLQNIHLYDTSNYPTDNPLYCLDHKKQIGSMKDELGGYAMKEFVALHPKMYSFVYNIKDKEINEKRCKGIPRVVVTNELLHEHYKNTLLESKQIKSTMYGLRSDHHIMYCDKIDKVSLSAFDDKRYLLEGGISSLAFGQHKIKK